MEVDSKMLNRLGASVLSKTCRGDLVSQSGTGSHWFDLNFPSSDIESILQAGPSFLEGR